MSEPLEWNAKTIAEFRANEGRVGGTFEGAPMVLVHHRGRTSGREYVTPMMYLPHSTEPGSIYVFATKGGAPTDPEWYRNLAAAGTGSVERGTETYQVAVRELTGAERDRSTPSKRGATRALPNTNAKPLESAPFPSSNSGGRSPAGRSAELLVTGAGGHLRKLYVPPRCCDVLNREGGDRRMRSTIPPSPAAPAAPNGPAVLGSGSCPGRRWLSPVVTPGYLGR